MSCKLLDEDNCDGFSAGGIVGVFVVVIPHWRNPQPPLQQSFKESKVPAADILPVIFPPPPTGHTDNCPPVPWIRRRFDNRYGYFRLCFILSNC